VFAGEKTEGRNLMSMSSEDRKELLNQLAEGEITASQAAELINGSKQEKPAQEEMSHPLSGSQTIEVTKQDIIKMEQQDGEGNRPTWFHVRVSDLKSGKNRVTVNIPLRLIGMGLNIGKRFAPELDGMDWSEIKSTLLEEKGILVDVEDEEDGEHVLIYID
jgi:hypothetical protein